MVGIANIAALKESVERLVDAFDELLDVLESLGVDVMVEDSTRSQ